MDIPEVIIRNAERSDIDDLLKLLKASFSFEKDVTFDESKQRRGLVLMIGDCRKHHCVVVAQKDHEIIGMGSAQTLISIVEGGLVALVGEIMVVPSWKGKGIEQKVLDAIEHWAKTRGINTFWNINKRGTSRENDNRE